MSPSQRPGFVDGVVDALRDIEEPPKVGDDCEHDGDQENILGVLRDAPSGRDEVVKYVRGHQDSKVERLKLACR